MSIDEIKKRYLSLPDTMRIVETLVPMKVRDPNDKTKTINDPHGRIQQRRMDIVDEADSFKKPIIHFHTLPDHPVYEQNWQVFAEAFINIKKDIEFLIKELEKEKTNGTRLE